MPIYDELFDLSMIPNNLPSFRTHFDNHIMLVENSENFKYIIEGLKILHRSTRCRFDWLSVYKKFYETIAFVQLPVGVTHGDMNYTNFMFFKSEIILIDHDLMLNNGIIAFDYVDLFISRLQRYSKNNWMHVIIKIFQYHPKLLKQAVHEDFYVDFSTLLQLYVLNRLGRNYEFSHDPIIPKEFSKIFHID
jgi:thiamine kinase-like enzyme